MLNEEKIKEDFALWLANYKNNNHNVLPGPYSYHGFNMKPPTPEEDDLKLKNHVSFIVNNFNYDSYENQSTVSHNLVISYIKYVKYEKPYTITTSIYRRDGQMVVHMNHFEKGDIEEVIETIIKFIKEERNKKEVW